MCTAMSAEQCDLGLLHSTREELRGNLAAEIILDECNVKFGYEGTNVIEYVCDSKSAVKHLDSDIGNLKALKPLAADMDVILEIGRLREKNDNINRGFKWVRSHQSKTLDDDEKLNDRADHLATECRVDAEQGLIPVERKQCYVGAMATLKIHGTVVNKDLKTTIQNALYEEEMKKYLIKKYDWSDITFENIDWAALEMALKNKKGIHLVTINKMIHFWQPTNKYVGRNGRRGLEASLCPECTAVDEQMHYMVCKSEYFKEARAFAWKRFCEKMKWYKYEETMLRIIWIGIQNWIYNDFDEKLPKGDDVNQDEYLALVSAYNMQAVIGWDHFLVGKVSVGWKEYYSLRLPESKEKVGKILAFGRNLVDAIFTFTLNVWKRHNESVHGKTGKYSNRDITSLRGCIKEIYEELRDQVSTEDEWLFSIEVKIRMEQPVPQMVGWLERILWCFDDNIRDNYPVVNRAKHILHRMCMRSIYT